MRDLIEELKALNETALDVDAVANAFLSVLRAKDMNLAKKWLGVLLPAYVKGEIHSADYKDAKFILGRIVSDSYKEKTEHFWVKRGSTPESDFMWWLGNPSNLHELLAAKKKLDKAKPTTTISKHSGRKLSEVNPEFVNIAREFINATHPVAVIVKELKTKVIKGRKPLSPEKAAAKAAQLAAKDLKTCACCFRSIARLKNGKIADHGYTLPEQWMKTASCPGMRFQPLEVSDDGLKYMVKILTDHATMLTTRIAGTKKLKSLNVKKGWKGEFETITPDHPKWDYHLKALQANLDQELKRTKSDLATFENKLKNWKPIPDAA